MLAELKLMQQLNQRNIIIHYLIKTFCNNKGEIPFELINKGMDGGACLRRVEDKLVIFGFDTNKEQDKFIKEWDEKHPEEEHSCEHCSEEEEDDDKDLQDLIKKLKKKGTKVQIIHVKD